MIFLAFLYRISSLFKNLTANTQRTYLTAVTGITKHYQKSSDELSKEMIEDYLLYLKNENGKSRYTLI